MRYRNNKKLVNAIKQNAKKIFPMETYCIGEIKYSLVKAKFLKDEGKYYNKKPKFFHEIPEEKIKYYIDELASIKEMDINSLKVSNTIGKFIEKNICILSSR